MTAPAREALAGASWPGNVRELANVLERSAILVDGHLIGADDLALLPQIEARNTDAPTTITISNETRASARWRPRPEIAATRRRGWECRCGLPRQAEAVPDLLMSARLVAPL
jgi:DNA-binding NtrC family response regulator